MISAIFGSISVIAWARTYPAFFRTRWSLWLALAALALCFFMPMFHARTSSENFSGSALMLALALLVPTTNLAATSSTAIDPPLPLHRARAIAIGILFGAAFEFRYQVGFMVAGIMAWLLFYKRASLRALSTIALSLLATLLVTEALDAWCYHSWRVFPAFSYAKVNLFEHVAAQFGTEPWSFYFGSLLETVTTPIGIFFWISFALVWITRPENVLTWTTLPFFLVHCAIGHKEARFLFPMLIFAPTFAALAVQSICRALRSTASPARVRTALFTGALLLLAAYNMFLLVRATTLPLEAKFDAQEVLDDLHVSSAPLYFVKEDPYTYGNLEIDFYGPRSPSWIQLPSAADVVPLLQAPGSSPSFVWLEGDNFGSVAEPLLPYCKSIWSSRESIAPSAFTRIFGSQYLPRNDQFLLACQSPNKSRP
jgi:hypothetical protein